MTELLALVCDTLLSVLRDQVDGSFTALDPDAPLTRYGMDSLATVEAAVRLERATGRKIPPDLLAQTPTARAVARLLADEPVHDPIAENGNAAPAAKSTPFRQRMEQAMERIDQLRATDRYPYHPVTTAVEPGRVTIGGKRMVMLGSFEYLGLGDDPRILEAHAAALRRFGSGSRGAQVGTGRTSLHEVFEERVAAMFGAESAILFSTGYLACLAPIGAVVGVGDFVIGDALNHACIVDGCRLAGARFQSFAHNDVAALARLLCENPSAHSLVIAEGIYSMDGDLGRIPEIAELCRRHGAMLMVDEAHSLGVVGSTGRGVAEHYGLGGDAIDLKVGTLSKSFGGIGGFVAGRRGLMDYLRHHARGYVFCAALPAPNVAASLAALDVLAREPWRVERLQANARRWRDGLRALGYDTFTSETPIVPVRMPDETTAFEFTHRCKERGVFVVPVVFPAVPQNAPRLRTCMTAGLSDDDISQAIEVFAAVGRELGMIG